LASGVFGVAGRFGESMAKTRLLFKVIVLRNQTRQYLRIATSLQKKLGPTICAQAITISFAELLATGSIDSLRELGADQTGLSHTNFGTDFPTGWIFVQVSGVITGLA
jgi:hypothetical protein